MDVAKYEFKAGYVPSIQEYESAYKVSWMGIVSNEPATAQELPPTSTTAAAEKPQANALADAGALPQTVADSAIGAMLSMVGMVYFACMSYLGADTNAFEESDFSQGG
ncbi:MAG: hypothetical protein FWG10_08960 [Eubacteriaceae bacterium]|nr:hypothetical protein [Eubacteriaceae bacterium]